MLTRQGPHHVAQNSTTYSFPFCSPLTGEPSTNSFTSIAGAGSPTLRLCADARTAAHIRNTTEMVTIRFHMEDLLPTAESASNRIFRSVNHRRADSSARRGFARVLEPVRDRLVDGILSRLLLGPGINGPRASAVRAWRSLHR